MKGGENMERKELDNLVNVAFINFFTLGKETKKICLCNVDVKDSRHLACLHIAKLVRDMYDYEFCLSSDIFSYWDIRWKCHTKNWLRRARRKDKSRCVDIEDFVSHIEKANNQLYGFSQVYQEYFRIYDKK